MMTKAEWQQRAERAEREKIDLAKALKREADELAEMKAIRDHSVQARDTLRKAFEDAEQDKAKLAVRLDALQWALVLAQEQVRAAAKTIRQYEKQFGKVGLAG